MCETFFSSVDVSYLLFLFSPVETDKLLLVGVSSQLAAGGHGVTTGSVLGEGNRNNTKINEELWMLSILFLFSAVVWYLLLS